MNIAIVITHNKGDLANQAQIESIKGLVTRITDINTDPESGETFETYHYEINNLGVPHELRIYQIVPFGVNVPPNFYELDSHNVLYRAGDEDKTGDHPRFFNWGMKRGTDYGAEVVIHLEDVSKLDFKKLLPKLQKLSDQADKTEYVEDAACKVGTVKLLKDVGQLDETKTKNQALSTLKEQVVQKGLKNG